MLEFGKPKAGRCLEAKVGGNVHLIPLAANLPVPFAKRMRAAAKADEAARNELASDAFMDYFGTYMGEDFDVLDMEDFNTLVAEWQRLSTEGGVSTGESQASSR